MNEALTLNAMLYGERVGRAIRQFAKEDIGIIDDPEMYRKWLTSVVQRAYDYAWYEPEDG